MIHELREYTAVPARMPHLVRRFTDHALRLFERRGMDLVFIGVAADGAVLRAPGAGPGG